MRPLDGSGQTSTKDNTESTTSSNLNFSQHSRSNNDNSSTLPTSAAPSTSSITNNQTSSVQETSIKDLKAAVENIQKLFSIHLMESQQDADDT